MAVARMRRGTPRIDYWPGFVDVLTNLLLVFVFLLSVFALTQFMLSREISGRDTMLDQLRNQIAVLTDTLALERTESFDLTSTIASLQGDLTSAEDERNRLSGLLAGISAQADAAGGQVTGLSEELSQERQLSQQALSQVEILNLQIAALRSQLAAIGAALDASEAREDQAQVEIADLGNRLNVALAQRVEELEGFRSEFFGRLREILGNRDDMRVVGDRFVFQSEVLFASGDDRLNPAGQAQMRQLAGALRELEAEIPDDIAWVLRVDGHTDARPISGGRFIDNWALSTARAESVVRYLVLQGVSPQHLLPAGFGEFQPLETGNTDEVYARNRRIELKLTER